MFVLNDDLSIYATRGDIVFFTVTAEDDGAPHVFKAGDVVRIKIYGKKNANELVLQKDFPVVKDCESVEIYLSKEDTKIGEVISKPKDYWYEIVVNDDTKPQTIIGYDEDGAKVFKLFPEGKDITEYIPDAEDIPFVDTELDMTSPRPVQNQAIARAIVSLRAEFADTKETITDKSNNTEQAVAIERSRLDNLIAHKVTSLSQNLDYLDAITEGTRAKIDGTITSDGAFATVNVILREANLIYGGTTLDLFVIPSECRPIEVGLIHTEDGIEYRIGYEEVNKRYVLSLKAQSSVTVAPSGAGGVTMTYALGDHELLDLRVGEDGKIYDSAGNAVREQATAKLNNLVKADRAISGAYINVTGSIVANAAFSYVEVAVIPGAKVAYRFSADNTAACIAFFGRDGVMIESYPSSTIMKYYEVPENAYTMRATYNERSFLTLAHDIADIAAAIADERRENANQNDVLVTNRLANELIAGAYIRVSDGHIAPHTAYSYVETPAIPLSKIRYTFSSNQNMAGLAFYDSDNALISSVLAQKGTQELTVPENAVTIRATATETDNVVIIGDAREIALGVSENAKRIARLAQTTLGAPTIHIPSHSVAVVGREWNLYFDNVILCDNIENYDIRCAISPALTEWGNYGEFLRITPTAPGVHTVTLSVYNKFSNEVITEKSFTLDVISNVSVAGKKVIFIGDSLTDTAYYPAEIQHNLSKGGIQSLGTRTSSMTIGGVPLTVNHEGRGGWNTYDYFTETAHEMANAFYNPSTGTFDFSYYMEQQGYSGVDIVSIFLGTNGSNRLDNVKNIKAMIDSIHAYNKDIVVLVNLINMPATQTGYGYRKFDSTAYNFKHTVFKLNDEYIKNFDGVMDNVYVCEVYFNLDSKRDYGTATIPASARRATTITVQTNNVHPDSIGYLKFADVIYCNLLYHLTK